ncbi:phage minor head protein [Streptomyces sp. NBC_00268]|uniref:phage minor head protein n=1 Tax=Streptomyces sp. NBC_00268 TaxID=2975695 RepID=UPI0022597499|nr:phage minor head protein [Streptomyces sp. NBC_00268]MCX5189029.1 phage head morphogenesis protein [Streptomyces sp. NBC_00268]
MAEDLEQLLQDAEEAVAEEVSAVLTEVADEFAQQLADATELVAARFSVSRIARMFTDRMPRLVRRLLRVSEQAADHTAQATDSELPPEWDDLPGRYDDGRDLPPAMSDYVDVTEHLLRAVGDRLAEAAREELAAGVDAGEDIEQLRARLRERFTREGAQLGEAREERIARTEAGRAWNTATLGAARDATGSPAPVVKQWLTRHDDRVREDHARVDGQIRLLDEQFSVGGVKMDAPHDPTAPASQCVNCRCILAVHPETTAAANESQEAPGISEVRPDGRTAAADGSHLMGAMIALLPTEDDAARLALDGGEAAEEIHCTLFFLGDDASKWSEGERSEFIRAFEAALPDLGQPIQGHVTGAAHWNTDTDKPSWVWTISDDRDRADHDPTIGDARYAATAALEDTHHPDVPRQHSPWTAHVCAAYTDEAWPYEPMGERVGPITFDRVRVAFGDEHTDIPLGPQEELVATDVQEAPMLAVRTWSTPDDCAIAFEDQETGDGRIFAKGALKWDRKPMPLQYADEMLMGHQGAELAGAIKTVKRDGQRITATGPLYATRPAGADAIQLLDEGAPLGISVDLDDVDIEFVDKTLDPEDAAWLFASARLPHASVLPMEDGSMMLSASTRAEWTASDGAISRSRYDLQLITGPDGALTASVIRDTFAGTGVLTAAAGDADDPEKGLVIYEQKSGEFLVRITRARLRGATLVSMPAFKDARIVLDPIDETAAAPVPTITAAGETRDRVVVYVITSPAAVGAREVSRALGIAMSTARGHLNGAAKDGRIVKLSPGLFCGPSSMPEGEISAAMSGDLELPVHEDPDASWDGDKASSRVLTWATDDNGKVDADKLGAAFLWRDEDADPATAGAYKLGFCDVFDSGGGPRLEIVANAVYAIASVLQGGMGGVDVPDGEQDELRSRVDALYGRLSKAYGEDIRPPWADDEDEDDATASGGLRELEASAWTALQGLDPMPAAWFAEPTAEDLPPGSGGVHYKDGRVYGWVAQAGEPHAGYPGKKLTIESLGAIDLTHFLRARFALDDGTFIKAGAMTMNVGHHRDGAECETASCQFDDTRTVGAVVTVGLNDGGLWFSGAAAPWLSEWDRTVFAACQPSYHMRQGGGGQWQLRAVLTVPVPGHSSPLLAAMLPAVAERSNLALAASAAGLLPSLDDPSGQHPDTRPDDVRTASASSAGTAADLPGQRPDAVSSSMASVDAEALAAALVGGPLIDLIADAVTRRQDDRRAEIAAMAALVAQEPVAAQNGVI